MPDLDSPSSVVRYAYCNDGDLTTPICKPACFPFLNKRHRKNNVINGILNEDVCPFILLENEACQPICNEQYGLFNLSVFTSNYYTCKSAGICSSKVGRCTNNKECVGGVCVNNKCYEPNLNEIILQTINDAKDWCPNPSNLKYIANIQDSPQGYLMAKKYISMIKKKVTLKTSIIDEPVKKSFLLARIFLLVEHCLNVMEK